MRTPTMLPEPTMLTTAAEISAARQRVEKAYDPELLRTAGHRLVDLLADHIGQARRAAGKVLALVRSGGECAAGRRGAR